MNWVDTIIIIILAINIFNGMRRGLVASIFDSVAIVIAFIGSWRFGTFGIELFTGSMNMPGFVANILSYGLTGVAIYCVGALLGAILHKFLSDVFPPTYDVIGGGLVGALKGAMFAAVVIIPLMCTQSLPMDVYSAFQESVIVEWIRPTVEQRIPQLQDMIRANTGQITKLTKDLPL